MIAQLDAAIPAEPRRPFSVLLEQVWAAMAFEGLQSFMPLWLDVAAGAARGLQPHREIAVNIAEGFLGWVTNRLETHPKSDPPALAATFMACIEGLYLLKAMGLEALVEPAATELSTRFR
ncbi:MAG: hypothetical protein ABL996_03095 [Micropepsaceae bacterium]